MSEINPDEHVDTEEAAAALDPNVGTGTPETAPHDDPPTTLLERQPLRVVGAVQAIVAAAALIVALGVEIHWALLVAGGLYLFEEYKRLKVTPTALPRLSEDVPLTPAGE